MTEYVENDHVRLVADAGGTTWDTLFTVTPFTVTPDGSQTRLEMKMEAKAYQLLGKIMNVLIRPIVRKAIERDMDSVKSYCER